MSIRVLSQNLINQIAAGEVIERPSSVVKELIENAIDAGATKIDVNVRNSGKSYICVSDNGKGMSKADLEVCILRHATSKLPTDDLMNINFLGFRGEALPSIASVSKMVITSNNGEECWAIYIEGGEVKKIVPASYVKGTKIEVMDLFYNVPARLSFLKTDRGEMSSIIDVVERIALCHADKDFSLNDNLKLKSTDKANRVCDILGREFKDNFIEVDAVKYNLKVSGFISRPTYNKGTSATQYFYVNGRALKDKLLLSSLKAAYTDVIEKGKFPVCVLWIEIPLADIDVNVHPQKAEIRFKEQSNVRGAIISLIRMYLAQVEVKANVIDMQKTFEDKGKLNSNILAFSNEFQQPVPFVDAVCETEQTSFDDNILPLSVNSKTVATDEISSDDERLDFPLGIARGQLHNTYIISQVSDGIIILDQHACHERIVYEKIKHEILEGGIKKQIMLIPEIVELGEKKAGMILEVAKELSAFGLEIEEFGSGAILVREMPAILGDCDLQLLIKNIAEDIDDFNKAQILENRIAMISKTFACHTSIRAGKSLTIDEMNELLRQVEMSENAGQCNHGRRSYVKISLSDLGKLFDR
jgi:DNA mismatch repair protein MutL